MSGHVPMGGLPLFAPEPAANEPKADSQVGKVLAYIRTHGSIGDMEAFNELGIRRLAARVKDLRSAGHDIQTEMVKTNGGARVARYSL